MLTRHPVRSALAALVLTALLISAPAVTMAAEAAISVTLPQSVISEVIKKLVPLKIDPRAYGIPGMRGVLTVKNISALKLRKGGLSCRLQITGSHLGMTTNIGGRNLNLNVGSLAIDSIVDATLRFDAKNQVLYIRPVVKSTKAKQGSADTLLSMLNGSELPLQLQPLQPLISQVGNRMVAIRGRVVGISPENGALRLRLRPEVSTKNAR